MEKEINGIKLEICSNSVFSAKQAQAAGASRVELCQNLENGGTTPSYGQIKLTRAQLSIGVHVLIRPRAGDFLYNEDEIAEIKQDILFCKEQGCDGVVIGVLTKEGDVDIPLMQELVELAKPMCVVYHRAFDRCRDPFQALEDLISLKVDRILSSGLADRVGEGKEVLRQLIEQAAGRIEIMPGSGVNAANVLDYLKYTGAKSIHSSAKNSMKSQMEFHNPEIAGMDEDILYTDKKQVEEMIAQIKSL